MSAVQQETASKARENFFSLLEVAQKNPILIVRKSKIEAVLMSFDQWSDLVGSDDFPGLPTRPATSEEEEAIREAEKSEVITMTIDEAIEHAEKKNRAKQKKAVQ